MPEKMQKSIPVKLSLIVPVYNRPQEIQELLESLSNQSDPDFEVVIVEDGSILTCKDQAESFSNKLNIRYFFKPNTGPGVSRNYGYERCSGNYGIFLDSDCIIPSHYVETVKKSLNEHYVDAFGGPDKADESFTDLQKSIDYTMTSFITTGGIRGGGEKMDKFYPRSFNMGISRAVFEKTGGFPSARFADSKAAGEDIELSINIYNSGFSVGLIKEAYVFHKRRTSLKQFFRQVYNFGFARVTLSKRNKGTLKLVHLLPTLFTIGFVILLICAITISWWFLLPLLLFSMAIVLDASYKKNSIVIGFYSLATSFLQLFGYGLGFIDGIIKIYVIEKK